MLNMPVEEVKRKIREQAGLSQDEVNKRVQEKMKQLAGLISEEGACHIVANELNIALVPKAEDRLAADLLPGMRDVKQDLRVVQVYELRTFQSKFSEGEGKVASFLGGDESGVIRVTGWGERADEVAKLSPGDIVRVKNAYVKDNQGRAELHLNNNSSLAKSPEGVTVSAPQRQEEGEYARRKISELTRGDFRVELLGTVVQVYDPRFFERSDGAKGAVVNVLLDDGTGSVRVGCFDENAAKALGLSLKELLSKEGATLDEEKNALLGAIVLVRGRAKLNTVYNSIELTADELDSSPDAKAELERMGLEAPAERPVAEAPKTEGEVVEEPAEKTVESEAVEEDAPVDLDDLEDLDLEDLDEPEEK
jgi:ssDNA-binding replication factor A large subunit